MPHLLIGSVNFIGEGINVQQRTGCQDGLLQVGQLHSWSKIARREVWQAAPFPEGRYYEDMAVIAALIASTRSYRYVPETWVGYRQREGSILASGPSREMANDPLVRRHYLGEDFRL